MHVTAMVTLDWLLMHSEFDAVPFEVLILSCCISHKHGANAAVNTSTHNSPNFLKW
jgi:hypothetical protein